MSSDLKWLLIRKNSSFLVKRNGVVFSREAGNLTNKHSPKYSGLINKKTIHITSAPGETTKNIPIAVTVKTKNGSSKVGKIAKSFTLKKGGVRRSAKSLKGLVSTLRPDLQRVSFFFLSSLFLWLFLNLPWRR